MRIFAGRDPFVSVRRSIAVCGLHPGAGAMHLALSMGMYLGMIWRYGTAVIEIGGGSRLLDMPYDETLMRCGSVGFRLHEVDIYPGLDARSAVDVAGSGYEYIIYVYRADDDAPPLAADALRLCIGGIRPWQLRYYKDFFHKSDNTGYDVIKFLTVKPNTKDKRGFEKEFGRRIIPVPIIDDPFSLSRDDMRFLRSILPVKWQRSIR